MKTINIFISEKLKITKNMINNQYNGYEYVDLGLPSGTLWAKCNLGAENETEYGDYFAWAETETKKDYKLYRWSTYKYAKGVTEDKLTKYCNSKTFGHKGFIDNITQLELSDDVAHVNMGSKWHMPTKEQFKELFDNTTNKLIENYNDTGVNGILFTSKQNGNKLFFPAGGFVYEQLINKSFGYYWSSTVNEKYCDEIISMYFRTPNTLDFINMRRCNGAPIRPVLNK